jgi:hypothetical protein
MASFLFLALAAMTIAGGTAPTRDGASRASPIRLTVEQNENAVVLQVIGLATTACHANYALEVTGGGNRSTQRGTAALQPNAKVTLVTLRLASQSGSGWSALLSVDSCNGEKYEQLEGSS